MNNSSTSYFTVTKGVLYSYIASLPLLLLYELLIWISNPGASGTVRISVDVWFRQIVQLTGLHSTSIILGSVALLGGVLLYMKRADLHHIKKGYFLLMLAEAVLYSVIITITIHTFLDAILMADSSSQIKSLNTLQLYALSLGAGLYEELFFRVILVSILIFFFKRFTSRHSVSTTLSIVAAALIFSGVHYIGFYGDIFTLHSFLFRFLFGLGLNLIYVKRGFGITAWTHAVYDLIVVSSF
ncbi:MAG TPA: CPBP family intramembrane glutamic endopeptidase [Balneolaceae bacterium]|nr:CPBP family intramembrane glutamic endopeptidase [Balneolaceae bacterium]